MALFMGCVAPRMEGYQLCADGWLPSFPPEITRNVCLWVCAVCVFIARTVPHAAPRPAAVHSCDGAHVWGVVAGRTGPKHQLLSAAGLGDGTGLCTRLALTHRETFLWKRCLWKSLPMEIFVFGKFHVVDMDTDDMIAAFPAQPIATVNDLSPTVCQVWHTSMMSTHTPSSTGTQ